MSTQATSFLSYATSIGLFVKGLFISAAHAFALMPTEGKIGAVLGIGTFAINWYYQNRRTLAIEHQQRETAHE